MASWERRFGSNMGDLKKKRPEINTQKGTRPRVNKKKKREDYGVDGPKAGGNNWRTPKQQAGGGGALLGGVGKTTCGGNGRGRDTEICWRRRGPLHEKALCTK